LEEPPAGIVRAFISSVSLKALLEVPRHSDAVLELWETLIGAEFWKLASCEEVVLICRKDETASEIA
jgi:hypothetical protein